LVYIIINYFIRHTRQILSSQLKNIVLKKLKNFNSLNFYVRNYFYFYLQQSWAKFVNYYKNKLKGVVI
jgi:hypothetical protein